MSYLADSIAIKHKNIVSNQTKYLIISKPIIGSITQRVKRITDIDRPDVERLIPHHPFGTYLIHYCWSNTFTPKI
ncbi:MAG: hypothetical protein ACMUEM_01490 [Flavobacteriales bacterium AspAUS03]